MPPSYDITIIGGGPGGYIAAIRARQLGFSTALIESTHLGGVCLNWGCIPTKALLKSAYFFHKVHFMREFGISISEVQADLQAMVQQSRDIANTLSRGISGLMKKHQVSLYQGHGELAEKTILPSGHTQFTISITGESPHEITSRYVIIATGARARTLPFVAPEAAWTAKEAMIPDTLPKSLLVIGGGAIGIEFASFYQALGSEVTVVEQCAEILPTEDPEIARLARQEFEKQGIRFLLNHQLTSLTKQAGQTVASLNPSGGGSAVTWQGDQALLAIGVIGNTENLGLQMTAVQVHKGHIITHGPSATHEPGIYAIGDVAGAPWLAHKASHEGIVCVEALAGKIVHPLDTSLIPGCVYSSPQIASLGLTEPAAKERGLPLKVGRFPFRANGQALAQREPMGLIKTLFHADTGELLGAHMVGQGVTEMIQGFTIAKTLEATEEDLQHVIFPHPTLSEMMHEAILDADGRALHL